MVIGTPRVVLWDFDGTLGHRRHGTWAECLLEILDRQQPGHSWTFDEIFKALATGFPWHDCDTPHPHLTPPARWWAHITDVITTALTGLHMPGNAAATAAQAVRATYTDTTAWSLYPQALSALDSLSARGWSHILLSNHVPELPTILDALGLSARFRTVINSAATGYEKPHPQAFTHARRASGARGRMWMIGDNPHADIAGANAVGLDAIWVRRSRPDDIPDLARAAQTILHDECGCRPGSHGPRALEVAPLLETSPPAEARIASVRTAEAR